MSEYWVGMRSLGPEGGGGGEDGGDGGVSGVCMQYTERVSGVEEMERAPRMSRKGTNDGVRGSEVEVGDGVGEGEVGVEGEGEGLRGSEWIPERVRVRKWGALLTRPTEAMITGEETSMTQHQHQHRHRHRPNKKSKSKMGVTPTTPSTDS